MHASPIQEALTLMAQPGLLSFALGLPAAEAFPTRAIGDALAHVLARDPMALQYQAALGALRERIVALMARRGVACTAEQVFVTAGAQQGMSLLARVLIGPGQPVMVEDRTYPGLLQVLEPFDAERLVVATDATRGIDPDAVHSALERGPRPAFLYTMSDGHNPLGVSTPRATRERLADLARRYEMPIVEDDAYGLLHHGDGEPVAPIRAHEDRWVYYVGSFSKVLAPGLRVGWLVVPAALVPYLAIVKESYDINTANLTQRAVLRLLETDALAAHLPTLRATYRPRCDAMLAALAAHFPRGTRVARPEGGLFAWVELPAPVDTARLLADAVATERIAFVPGAAFATAGARSADHCMRLNFSNVPPERIEDGIARLGALARRAVERAS